MKLVVSRSIRLYVDYCHKKLLDTQEYILIQNPIQMHGYPVDTQVIIIDDQLDPEFMDFIRERFMNVALDYYLPAPSIHPMLPS